MSDGVSKSAVRLIIVDYLALTDSRKHGPSARATLRVCE
jgi:hypothetical protein